MVGVIRRMNRLNAQLLNLRHGPGAAILPPEITRIHMEFAARWNNGHYGPRKFWRDCLPRLKYWNPAVPMVVDRKTDQAGPATLTVHFRPSASVPVSPVQPASSASGQSAAPGPGADERVVTIDMKNQRPETILQAFLAKTGAVPVTPTPQEAAEIRDVEEQKKRSQADREVMRTYLEAQRREAALIAQAKSEAAIIRQNN